jgi:hypothetical protein
MSSTIPQLTLFPLYRGGPRVNPSGSVSATSSFYFPATEFTPIYGVNVPPQSNRASNTAYSLGANQPIQRASGGTPFAEPLGFDATVLGGLKKTQVPSVAPVIPNLYEQAAKLLSVSDLKMSELLSQPSFNISNIGPGTGLGLNVKTDGSGGIDSVSLRLSSAALNPNPSALDPGFGGLKRAEITTGAVFKTTVDSGLGGTTAVQPANKLLANTAAADNTAVNPLLKGLQELFGAQQVSRLQATDFNLFDFDDNPILQRLNQLQPPETGLPVSGFDSAISAEEARLIAASQARLDVTPSPEFRQNVAGLVNAASRQATDNYANAFKQVNLDGRIPMAPSLPASSQGVGHSGAGMGQDGFNLNSGLADANDKKGNGGYIPFQMQSNTHGGFSGSGNPFMAAGGFSQGQPQQQRRRLPAFVA